MTNLIKLNVSGCMFEVDINVLKKINYFKYLLEDTNHDINQVIFVGRAPHIFKHVLALAIDENYGYPIKYKSELDFYDVTYDVNKMYDPTLVNYECCRLVVKRIDEIYKGLKNEINPSCKPNRCSGGFGYGCG